MENRFNVVDAETKDMKWIRDLAISASIHTFCGLRSSPQQRAKYVGQEFEELKTYVSEGSFRFLLAVDTEKQANAGYLLLNLYDQDDLGRRQTFVEDIAALPEYWGLGVGHFLFDAATKITAELGLHFMGGEVAAENSRIEAALRNNFFLESYRVVRPCTPEAKALMAEVSKQKEQQETVNGKIQALKERRLKRKARRAQKNSGPTS